MSRDPSESVAELIADARQHGGELVGDLLNRYQNYLFLVARTQIDLHLSVRASPSDVVQDTFLQATREFGTFAGNDGRQLLAWLRKILVNNIISAYDRHVRAQKRDLRRERSLHTLARTIDQSSMQLEQALARSGDAPDHEAMQHEQAAYVADLLAQLPDQYREVIILRNLHEFTFEEIASRMGRSSAAVRKLWTRAIARLRIETDHDESDEPLQ